MYQKLVIREADAHVLLDASRLEQRQPRKKLLTLDVIRPDRMIICSDWPTM